MSNQAAATTARILVIDDNPAIHSDFHKIFGRSDDRNSDLDAVEAAFFGDEPVRSTPPLKVEIDSAHQGKDGWEKVKQSVIEQMPYTMAFVDMRMPPGWNGLTTIQKLWESDPSLHVVICSAYSDYSWEDIVKEIGCSDRLMILKKPFDNAEVQQLAVAISEKCVAAAEMKEACRRSERHAIEAERLLAAVNFLLIGINDDGVIERWNSQASSILQIPAGDVSGKKLEDLDVSWQDSSAVRDFVASRENGNRVFAIGQPDEQKLVRLTRVPTSDLDEPTTMILLGTVDN